MILQGLITEYKDQAVICSSVNYSDKQSVNKNNYSIKKMYEIVEIINSEFGVIGVVEFSRLLDIKENNIYIWAASQLLEKMNPSQEIREKALGIIEEVSKEDSVRGIGFRNFLRQYETR